MQDIRAVIFDLDGTLVDSECRVEEAIEAIASAHNGAGVVDIDYGVLYGLTWERIAATLAEAAPNLAGALTAEKLRARFNTLCLTRPPPLIPGARNAVLAASAVAHTAIATSSNRDWVEVVLLRMDIRAILNDYVCADDYRRSKPDPECYLLAADRLQTRPDRCLVFEDSVAGLRAAKAAGMRTIAITHSAHDPDEARRVAERSIADFRELSPDFFARVTRLG